MLAMWAGMHDSFGYGWSRQYGSAEEDTIKTWARALYSKSGYVLKAMELLLNQWGEDFPPTLPQFKTFVALAYDNAHRHRPAPAPGDKPALPKTVQKRTEPSEIQLQEQAKQKAILAGPKKRDQSFVDAYHHLGLQNVHGPLKTKKETEQ